MKRALVMMVVVLGSVALGQACSLNPQPLPPGEQPDSAVPGSGDTGGTSGNTAIGTLTINGTIAQNFRGRLAEGNPQFTGYVKNYWYDQRLATLEPPYFLDPVGTNWTVTRVTECDGSTGC